LKRSKIQISASIKPQQVYNITQVFDGTGKELLEKYDERGISNQLIKTLDLKNSIDQNVKELSGGELQRLAVAIASQRMQISTFLMNHHHIMIYTNVWVLQELFKT